MAEKYVGVNVSMQAHGPHTSHTGCRADHMVLHTKHMVVVRCACSRLGSAGCGPRTAAHINLC
jgi:hypothetical protein